MSEEDVTDEPSSEVPESSQGDTKAVDEVSSTEETDYLHAESCKTYGLLDIVNMVYNDRYYWEIFKSAIVFILALKMARECHMMRIPIKEYKPFNRN